MTQVVEINPAETQELAYTLNTVAVYTLATTQNPR